MIVRVEEEQEIKLISYSDLLEYEKESCAVIKNICIGISKCSQFSCFVAAEWTGLPKDRYGHITVFTLG